MSLHTSTVARSWAQLGQWVDVNAIKTVYLNSHVLSIKQQFDKAGDGAGRLSLEQFIAFMMGVEKELDSAIVPKFSSRGELAKQFKAVSKGQGSVSWRLFMAWARKRKPQFLAPVKVLNQLKYDFDVLLNDSKSPSGGRPSLDADCVCAKFPHYKTYINKHSSSRVVTSKEFVRAGVNHMLDVWKEANANRTQQQEDASVALQFLNASQLITKAGGAGFTEEEVEACFGSQWYERDDIASHFKAIDELGVTFECKEEILITVKNLMLDEDLTLSAVSLTSPVAQYVMTVTDWESDGFGQAFVEGDDEKHGSYSLREQAERFQQAVKESELLGVSMSIVECEQWLELHQAETEKHAHFIMEMSDNGIEFECVEDLLCAIQVLSEDISVVDVEGVELLLETVAPCAISYVLQEKAKDMDSCQWEAIVATVSRKGDSNTQKRDISPTWQRAVHKLCNMINGSKLLQRCDGKLEYEALEAVMSEGLEAGVAYQARMIQRCGLILRHVSGMHVENVIFSQIDELVGTIRLLLTPLRSKWLQLPAGLSPILKRYLRKQAKFQRSALKLNLNAVSTDETIVRREDAGAHYLPHPSFLDTNAHQTLGQNGGNYQQFRGGGGRGELKPMAKWRGSGDALCQFPGCDLPALRAGFCSLHHLSGK